MVAICYNNWRKAPEPVMFGLRSLKEALAFQKITVMEAPLSYRSNKSVSCVRVNLKRNADCAAEGFSISVLGKDITLTAGDTTGAMYGLFELEESIRRGGLEAVKDKVSAPFLPVRGVKFNLPFQPYSDGEVHHKSIPTVMDKNFWKEYIDFLCRNRYNCLSLWAENPFPNMLNITKYPNATDLTPEQLTNSMDVFRFIFSYAKKRGLETFLFTWNIRITPGIAKGLGLPAAFGTMHGNERGIHMLQSLPAIKDYFTEAVKTLFETYPELTGIGTSCSEEMRGPMEKRQQWVTEAYLGALDQLGADIPVILRTNTTNGNTVRTLFLDRSKSSRKYISWKYSNAHMYSHPHPKFEEIFGAWDEMDMSDVNVLYTVRNDDFQNLRGGDPVFMREYIEGMKKPYVKGFYWGADGYNWSAEFQHAKHLHMEWKYSFQKHWMEFEMMGRLAYDPALPEEHWVTRFSEHYGSELAEPLYRGLQAGTRIICALTRQYWIHYDHQWFPEGFLCSDGFKTVIDFVNGSSMPGVGTVGLMEYADGINTGKTFDGETPLDILSVFEKQIQVLDTAIKKINTDFPYLSGEIECVFNDLQAWRAYGAYCFGKVKAALELCFLSVNGNEERRDNAVALLKQASKDWAELARIGASHYLPYELLRVNSRIFGWSYYQSDVDDDIRLAEEFAR